MAYTKIRSIKSTVDKAIAYITNPNKTSNSIYIYGYNVAPKTASIEFEFTERIAKDIKGDFKKEKGNLAYHLIQSFDYKDILTPKEAMEIGKKTIEELTDKKYEYVISTHVDGNCIHNHIIFNAVSFIDYKRFNCKPYKTVAKIREISDKYCLENGLNIIKTNNQKGISYYEWTMKKQGLSWKENLKNIIDKNILKAKSFEEFLELMKENKYEIKQGKYLAFKYINQERFIRSYKIGLDYSEEKIKERINNKAKEIKINFKGKNIYKKQLPLHIQLKLKSRKIAIKNIKETFNSIYRLGKNYNIETMNDLIEQKGNASIKSNEIKSTLKGIEKEIKQTQEKQRNILIYLKYNDLNNKYQKAINKNAFYMKYESELILYNSAIKNLEILTPEEIKTEKNINEEKIKNLQETYISLKTELQKETEKIKDIEKVESKILELSKSEKEKQKSKKKNIEL